jgi:aspartate racemase
MGAGGIILGCTEIPMLIKPEDVNIPLYDTLKIHLKAAVSFLLDSV